jgi:hypothetical protein
MDNALAILITWNPFYKTGCSLYTLHHPPQSPLSKGGRRVYILYNIINAQPRQLCF